MPLASTGRPGAEEFCAGVAPPGVEPLEAFEADVSEKPKLPPEEVVKSPVGWLDPPNPSPDPAAPMPGPA